MTEKDFILEARNLSRHFTSQASFFRPPTVVRAVDGVTLGIRAGETFAIVGESGCGKSTLARLLIRLIEPSGGCVFFEGAPIGGLGSGDLRALRKDLQFVFQDPFSSLNPRMTVGALIEEPMRVHGIGDRRQRRRRVAELLAKVGLRAEHASRYPHEFSGGQRQRIGIARALASGPKLVIADEPVSALDVSIQAQVINLLEDLKQEFNLTLVLIAHDLAVIRHMSDRVAVMYLGEIVELASTEALFERPLHPYTRALMESIPVPSVRPARRGQTLGGDVPSPASPPPGCRFHTRCPHASQRCTLEKPQLQETGAGRLVACHHWRETGADRPEPASQAPTSPNVAARFALYRTWSEKKEEETSSIQV